MNETNLGIQKVASCPLLQLLKYIQIMLNCINHKCYSNNLELLIFFFYEFDNSIFLAKYSFRFYYPLKNPSKIHTITTGEVSGHVVSNKSVNRKQGSNKKCLFRLMSFVVAYSELFIHPILMAFVCTPVVFFGTLLITNYIFSIHSWWLASYCLFKIWNILCL